MKGTNWTIYLSQAYSGHLTYGKLVRHEHLFLWNCGGVPDLRGRLGNIADLPRMTRSAEVHFCIPWLIYLALQRLEPIRTY